MRPVARHTHTLSRPSSRSKPTTSTTVTTEQDHRHRRGEAQSSRSTTCVSITMASVMTREPPKQSGDDEEAQGLDETRRARPRRHPAGWSGKRQPSESAAHGPAPMTWAARVQAGSMFRRGGEDRGRMAKRQKHTSPYRITTPASLYMSRSGSSITCSRRRRFIEHAVWPGGGPSRHRSAPGYWSRGAAGQTPLMTRKVTTRHGSARS